MGFNAGKETRKGHSSPLPPFPLPSSTEPWLHPSPGWAGTGQPPWLDVLQLAECEKLTSACKTISCQPACILGFRWRTSVD